MYKMLNKIAEIAGMFAADGCLQRDYLCIWGNIHQDKHYYNNIVKPIFKKVFNVNIKLHEKKSNSVYGFYLCNKDIIKFFNEKLGFPIGNKTYNVAVPKIILKSKNLKVYSSFIRGFVDCDGCLNFDRKRGNYSMFKKTYHFYPRVLIKCASQKIIKDINFMLRCLGVNKKINIIKSNKNNEVDQYIIKLDGSKAIQFIHKIGSNNQVNVTKYNIWKKFGFCPPNTTLEERQKILKGEINPYLYYGPVAQPG